MNHRASLAHWTEVLTGIDPDRCLAALHQVEHWDIDHVNAELLSDTVDAAVAATLLVEGIEELVAHDVRRERLLKKLRTGAFWPTWAEIRIAHVLLRVHEEQLAVELEAGRARGAHADWRFSFAETSDGISIEVKAVGLSTAEVAFCERMAPALPQLLPKHGLTHGHASIHALPPRAPGQARRAGQKISRAAARTVPGYPMGLRGAVLVGHDSEDSYRQRIAAKVHDAVRQLPTGDECWVALYWANGAPLENAASAIDWSTIPEHVVGVLFVGQCVAFPHREIHCYAIPLERTHSQHAPMAVHSVDGNATDTGGSFKSLEHQLGDRLHFRHCCALVSGT